MEKKSEAGAAKILAGSSALREDKKHKEIVAGAGAAKKFAGSPALLSSNLTRQILNLDPQKCTPLTNPIQIIFRVVICMATS